MSDNYVLALEKERESREAELTRLRADMERLARTTDEFADQARIATRERDEARQERDLAYSSGVGDSAKRIDELLARAEAAEAIISACQKAFRQRDMDADDLQDAVSTLVGAFSRRLVDLNESNKTREKAEADCAALKHILAGLERSGSGSPTRDGFCPVCAFADGHSDSCDLGHALHGAFPAGDTILERLRAAEAVVEAYRKLRNHMHADECSYHDESWADGCTCISHPVEEAFAAYDALKDTP